MDRDKYVVRSYSTTRKSDYELIKLAKLKRKSASEIVRCAVEEYLQKEYNAKKVWKNKKRGLWYLPSYQSLLLLC